MVHEHQARHDLAVKRSRDGRWSTTRAPSRRIYSTPLVGSRSPQRARDGQAGPAEPGQRAVDAATAASAAPPG
ncbi:MULTISPECIES: hypothetical protein [Streptacidiphilus]|uniref:Integrase n=1 Tax=Streptacidiphilus cavernicola TaxID=3342716 RepID=A0ABV6UWH7_9ACTN|nr:hypothetical protein [Streptacidiphilus jeojiense]